MTERSGQSYEWDAAGYAAHSASQQAWARELIGRIHFQGGECILDVGCGDGKVTAELARAVPQGSVVGVDSSSDMIQFARENFPPRKVANLRFRRMDARHLRFHQRFDLIFSNAALHWVDDHQAFLRGAARCLCDGGRLVVSCGGKGNAHGVFLALRAELRQKRWRQFFREMPRAYFFYSPAEYKDWLSQAGFNIEHLGLVDKDMPWTGPHGLAAWFRTTWHPYTQRVPEPLREEFIAAVTDRYLAKHPPDADGLIHVRMVRLEIEAIKRGSGRRPSVSGTSPSQKRHVGPYSGRKAWAASPLA
jgi:trans-aconitate methyltransferase